MDLTFNTPDTVLMLGNESEHMSDNQLVSAARFAAKLGFKAITFKVGDGAIRYRNAQEVFNTIDAINDTGMGAMPFIYIYGPKFGDTQIQIEANIINEVANEGYGTVVVDMESEWNNNPRACDLLVKHLIDGDFLKNRNHLIISTWADPLEQNWQENILELNRIVEKYGAWSPQQYSLWLMQREKELHQAKGDIFPEVNMMGDPIAVARHAALKRHKSLWIWEYHMVESMQLLAKSVLNTFLKGEQTKMTPAIKLDDSWLTNTVVVPSTTTTRFEDNFIVPLSTSITQDYVETLKENVDMAEKILSGLAEGGSPDDFHTYVVQVWDTVESIALSLGISKEKLLEQNPGLEELLKDTWNAAGMVVKY